MNEASGHIDVWSPMPRGSGAFLVHQALARRLQGYRVKPYDPCRQYFPFSLLPLRNRSAAVVHTAPDQAVLLACRHQPLVVTFHSFFFDKAFWKHCSLAQRVHYATDLKWLVTRAIARADAITAVSRFVADQVREHFDPDKPIKVIENGVDTSLFSPAVHTVRSPVRVLVSGNPARRKGTHLIGLIAAGLKPGIEIICTLTEREKSQWIGNASNVRAIGRQAAERMPEIYRSSDILLMPTAREAFGLAVVEAMACGLPVVASDTSTMPYLVSQGQGGWLCAFDRPDEYAARINELAAAPGTREEMGRFNRNEATRRFSMQKMVDAYGALFREVSGSGQ